MKQDTVKKCNLCKKCLKLGLHSVQNCYADPCSKCGGDHHTLICPKPKGEQVFMNNVEVRLKVPSINFQIRLDIDPVTLFSSFKL